MENSVVEETTGQSRVLFYTSQLNTYMDLKHSSRLVIWLVKSRGLESATMNCDLNFLLFTETIILVGK